MKLVTIPIKSNEPLVQTVESVNRILVIDCSGSMSYELPKLRTQLKNKLPTMVQVQDTLSIIWFSGKNQFGILFEGMKLDNVQDLANVNSAIDRFLKPVGMTAFVQPLEEVIALTQRLTGACSLHFMSDGGDNSYSKKDIIEVCKKLSDHISSASFIEYGFYADHKTLMEMAEETSGSVILAEDYQSYSDNIEASFKSSASSKKIKVKQVKASYVIGNQSNGFVIAKPDAVGTVTLPSNVHSYTYFEGSGDLESYTVSKDTAYAISALIQRGEPDIALQLAAMIGDEDLYNQVQNSFSKQDYAACVELANQYGSGVKPYYASAPRNTGLVQDPNAYNVLTLLMDLASEDGNYLHISHPDFVYKAGGDKRNTVTSEDGYTPKFSSVSKDIRAKITTLKFDEDRPNINLLVRRDGTVNLPKNEFGFGDNFDTYIWRNYSIVRDGIVNVKKLPVILSKSTHDLFTQLGVITEPFKVNHTYVIDLKKYSIINRAMTNKCTALSLFNDVFDLYKLRSAQKYLSSKIEKPEVSEKFSALYGEDGAKFLKECGITEGGFSPKTVKGESLDPYIAKVLEVKLSSLSGIPKIEDAEKAISSGKSLTPSMQVMKDVINKYKNEQDLKKHLDLVKVSIKDKLSKIIMTKFGVIIGRTWFTDLPTMEDTSMDLDLGLSKVITCTVNLTDKEV